jgi:two-component system, sensor histidine kinase and response regulator
VAQDIVAEVCRKLAARYKREGDLVLKLENASLLVPAENLAKIVEEIADNAFKFSEPGRPVLISIHVVDHTFHLSVIDTGRGMTVEQISRIGPHMQFERKTFEQQGAGLGLIIAKRLTELLGGLMLVESKAGQGTTAKVSFAMPGI